MMSGLRRYQRCLGDLFGNTTVGGTLGGLRGHNTVRWVISGTLVQGTQHCQVRCISGISASGDTTLSGKVISGILRSGDTTLSIRYRDTRCGDTTLSNAIITNASITNDLSPMRLSASSIDIGFTNGAHICL